MWRRKLPDKSFIDNCLQSILTVNRILKDGNYFASANNDSQNIKVSIETETNTVLLEVKLQEQAGSTFISSLKNNSLTKHLPVLMVTKSKTQFYWDKLNLTGNCFSNIKSGKNPWLMVKINTVA
jgi:response regulator RpfG family c-di-GMP phosphodiesterase